MPYILSILLVVVLLSGCASRETRPKVLIAKNQSGIEAEGMYFHGPSNLLRFMGQPDVPSTTSIPIRNAFVLNKGVADRYFIPARGVLQIVSIEKTEAYPRLKDTVRKWRNLIDSKEMADSEAQKILNEGGVGAGPGPAQLAEIPWQDAGRCFQAKFRRYNFPWGKAVLFITTYVQGHTGGPVNNAMLVLVVQGLTKDGRYAVHGSFQIKNALLPDSSWDLNTNGKAIFSIDDDYDKAGKWLDSQPDDSFMPTVSQHEEFLKHIRITH